MDFDPYNQICISNKIRHHDLKEITIVVIEKNGLYFYLEDDIDKISEIVRMPNYIKGDWIKYNKKQLIIPILDELIEVFDYTEYVPENYKGDAFFVDTHSLLKSLRRDLLIGNII